MKIISSAKSFILTFLLLTSYQAEGKFFSKTSITSLFSTPTLKTPTKNLHIDHLSGLHTELTPNAQKYSVVHGAALWESSYFKRLYTFGNKENATVKLVNRLFYSKNEQQFVPTQHKTNPCYSLSPELIGKIIGTVATNTFGQEDVQRTIAQEWQLTAKNLGSHFNIGKVRTILSTIESSMQECNNPESLYLPYNTEMLFLGYLYSKATTKEEIIRYLQTLHTFLPVFKNNSSLQNILSPVHDATVLEHCKKESITNVSLEQLLQNHYESFVYQSIDNRYKQSPPVIQKSYGFNNKKAVPDCFETAMRGVINKILENKESLCFDLSLLPSTIHPQKQLQEFYTIYNTFTMVNDSNTSTKLSPGQAWMNIVSAQPELSYHYDDYELNPSIGNMLGLFNCLFNSNAKNLTELGKTLSDHRRTITFTPQKDEHAYLDDNTITITLDNHKNVETLVLTISPTHAYVTIPLKHQNPLLLNNHNTFAHVLDKIHRHVNDPFYNKSLVPSIASIMSLSETFNSNFTLTDKTLYHQLLSQPLEEANQHLAIAIDVARIIYHKQESTGFTKLLISLLQQLPQNEHFYRRTGDLIAYYNLYDKDSFFYEYLTHHIPALEAALTCEIKKEHPNVAHIVKLLPSIPAKSVHAERIKTAISYYIGNGKHPMLDSFLHTDILDLD